MDFKNFTVDNGAIRDLRELMFMTAFADPDLEAILTTKTGVYNGKKLGFINDLGDVGLDRNGCNPEYSNINITGVEKEWNLGTWEIAKHICYTELENTIAEHCLEGGTEIDDLGPTVYMNEILIPLLQKAMKEMFWRIAWFGDKDAKNIADSGVLTAGVNPKLFTMCDGLWKHLQAIIAANPGQHTVIEANSATSYAEQKNGLRTSGTAIKIVDDMLSDADSRIFDDPNAAIFMTSSLFKALRNDLVDKYGKYTMPVEQLAAGINLAQYDGHKIIALDIWDRMIKKYEDTGTKLNCPHRAVITTPSNLFVGTNDKKMVSTLRVNFNEETEYNNILAKSKIGTLVGEDALVQVAI